MNQHVSRRIRKLSLGLIGAGLILAAATPAVGASRVVHVLPTTGVVDGVMAGYISEGIAKAAREGGAAGVIELNVAGLIFIGLAVVLLVLEATVTSHGLLTVGAVVTFVLGAAALYTEPGSPTLPTVTVSWPIIGLVAGSAVLFGLLVARAAVATRRLPPVAIGAGAGAAVDAAGVAPGAGSVGLVRASLAPSGTVVVASEEWSARSASGVPIDRGDPVRVVGREGLTLLVEPAPDPAGRGDAGSVARPASGSPPGAAALS